MEDLLYERRFDSALRVDVHFHALVLDGVYTDLGYGQSPRFHAAEKPTDAELDWLVRHIHALIVGHLQRAGYLTDDARIASGLIDEDDPLVHCHAAAIQGKVAFGPRRGQSVGLWGCRREEERPRTQKQLCADFGGFSLHAAARVPAGEVHRPRLERLARYACRSPLAKDRLLQTRSGQVVYKFRRPWRNGAEAVVMDPLTFLSRLAALVPFKRQHLLTYHGILAPAASARDRIVPERDDPPQSRSCGRSPGGGEVDASGSSKSSLGQGTRRRYIPWAELLRRVFLHEVLTCPRCTGKRRVLSMVRDPAAIHRILSHLGLDPRPPPRAPPRFVQRSLRFH